MVFGALGLTIGAVVALGASRFPAYQIRVEQGAGLLIIFGLGLIGLGFPLI